MLLALDLLAVCATLIAVVFDERSRRIPNWLSYGTSLSALLTYLAAFAAYGGKTWPLLGSALLGGALLGLAFGVLSVVGVLGSGDSKLLLGIGLCVRYPLALQLALCVLLSGGLVAVLQMGLRGSARGVLKNLGQGRRLMQQRVDASDEPRHKHLFGYALAIALGTLWAVAGRYEPALLPL